MVPNLRIGIIGSGFGAQVQLPAFKSMKGVEVAALCDSGSGKNINKDIESKVKNVYHDWKEVVYNDNIDAISVTTPPHVQKKIVCEALASGKHILCEKPFGKNLKDAKTMYATAKKSNLVHAVDFQFRMEPGIAALKSEIFNGTIGKFIRIDVSWLTGGGLDPSRIWSWQHDADSGGGILGAFGSHVIDYIQWITESKIITVYASAQILYPFRNNSSGSIKKVSAEDSMDLICNLSNGSIANLRLSNCHPYTSGHRIEVFGTKGRIIFSHKKPFTIDEMFLQKENSASGVEFISLNRNQITKKLDTRVLAFQQLAKLFEESIHGIPQPDLPTFEDGINVQRVMESARLSIKNKSLISVSDLP
jgi:predicted dehydrogenase